MSAPLFDAVTAHAKKQKVSMAVLQTLLKLSTQEKNNLGGNRKWLYLNHMRDELTKSILF